MSAGAGIVHSERTSAEQRAMGPRLFGIQAWAALPKSHEERAPTFAHYDAARLPRITGEGKTVRIVMGQMYGQTLAGGVSAPQLLRRSRAGAGRRACRSIPTTTSGRSTSSPARSTSPAKSFGGGRLLVFKPGDRISVLATSQARLILLGGEPMDGPRHIWWNFVSSSKDRIDAAKADWKAKRFGSVPGDGEEFIPLPDDRPA